MEKSITRKVIALLVMILPWLAANVWAARPEVGKVYQFTNLASGLALTAAGADDGLVGSNANSKNTAQLWLVEKGSASSNYYLRNLMTGLYMTDSRAQSVQWSLSDKKTVAQRMRFNNLEEYTTIGTGAGDFDYAHCDGSNRIVCWRMSDNDNSRWNLVEVEMTQEEIDQALEESKHLVPTDDDVTGWQALLDKIFEDKACTKLRSGYSDEDVAKLPAALQAMVAKTKSGDWSETNKFTDKWGNAQTAEWDSEHAKKFRIQSYEPYSRGTQASQMVGIQSYGNWNNPTGIIADSREVLYIMVDKAPKDGSTIYIHGVTGAGYWEHMEWNLGIELHEGLNVVPVWQDSELQYIYYTVGTYENGVRKNPLDEFDDITIHIEGGDINSFFDYRGDKLYKADTNADWEYYRDRAQHLMYDIVGQYVLLHLYLHTDFVNPPESDWTSPGVAEILGPGVDFDLPYIMSKWDQMCLSERLVMGLQSPESTVSPESQGYYIYPPKSDELLGDKDYYRYFNNRMMGIATQGNLYMNATTYRTAYSLSTIQSILLDLPKGGAIWGPAHEYGHMNQGPMKLAGTTEISNNVFSNVAVFYQGLLTSRSSYPSEQREVFNQGKTFLENGIWGTTRMYLQLWLYYHQAGNNRLFYPRLYELLRQNPRDQGNSWTNGIRNTNSRYDDLHFVKMCCIAAGEDLTEYFEAWGFFVPLKDYYIGDYSEFYLTRTQADIDAVKAEIAALNLPKNHSMLFIDDRVGSERPSWADYMAKENCGDLGGLKDFGQGCPVTKPYTYKVVGPKVTMSDGEGGVGFLIYDPQGKLMAFSNSYEFNVNSKTAELLAKGQARVVAVGSDSKLTDAENAITNATPAEMKEMLEAMIGVATGYVDRIDDSNSLVGHFKATSTGTFEQAYADAQTAAAGSDAAAYKSAYDNLVNEYFALGNNKYAQVRLVPGNIYTITNREYGKNLAAAGGIVVQRSVSPKSKLQQWVFEGGTAGQYRMKNVSSKTYIGETKRSREISMGKDTMLYALVDVGDGYFAFAYNADNSLSLHQDANGRIVGWNSDITPSQWLITLVEADEVAEARAELSELLTQTEQALEQSGKFETKTDMLTLGEDNFFTNAKCDIGGDAFRSWSVLYDNNPATYFHSQWGKNGSEDGEAHYLGVDLGEGNALQDFAFSYTTRGSGNVCGPFAIKVQGSNDKENWTDITFINQDLPSNNAETYDSEVINADQPYRYIRYVVTMNTTNQSVNGQYYFVISEFGMGPATFVAHPAAMYPDMTPALMLDARTALKQATPYATGEDAEAIRAQIDNLRAKYTALAAAMNNVAGIGSINADGVLDLDNLNGAEIYDLSGRRLNGIDAAGIYIINGKKVMVTPNRF